MRVRVQVIVELDDDDAERPPIVHDMSRSSAASWQSTRSGCS
jgi:hypothetical protein